MAFGVPLLLLLLVCLGRSSALLWAGNPVPLGVAGVLKRAKLLAKPAPITVPAWHCGCSFSRVPELTAGLPAILAVLAWLPYQGLPHSSTASAAAATTTTTTTAAAAPVELVGLPRLVPQMP